MISVGMFFLLFFVNDLFYQLSLSIMQNEDIGFLCFFCFYTPPFSGRGTECRQSLNGLRWSDAHYSKTSNVISNSPTLMAVLSEFLATKAKYLPVLLAGIVTVLAVPSVREKKVFDVL